MTTSRIEWPGMVSEYTVPPVDDAPTITRPNQIGIDFYDQPVQVDLADDAAVEHVRAHLPAAA